MILRATSGQTKQSKHLMLGITSLTGSREVIKVLNKLGNCVSYHVVEEIETPTTFEANKERALLPDQ